MDKLTAKHLDQIWSNLDEMAKNDPQSYKKLINSQFEEVQNLTKPLNYFSTITAFDSKSKSTIIINICTDSRVPAAKSQTDPLPMAAKEFKDFISNKKERIFILVINDETSKTLNTQILLNELYLLSLNFVNDLHNTQIDTSKENPFECLNEFQGDKKWLSNFFVSQSLEKTNTKSEIKFKNDFESEKMLIVPSSEKPKEKPLIETLDEKLEKNIQELNYDIEVKKRDEKKFYHLKIFLDNFSVDDLKLLCCEHDLKLEFQGRKDFSVEFENPVDVNCVISSYSKKSSTLHIIAPIND